MDGIINIYKERGYTSHDVVAKVRGILRTKKVGHTGTLDPEAEGVLPICIGRATKVADYLTDESKRYIATVRLGITTTTEDATGEIVEEKPVEATKEQIDKAIALFVGEYMQTPPMYSALKVNGKRLYELARAGITVERKARRVMIYECKIIDYNLPNEFRISVKCSKGTYIRTLCTDIGSILGCGAHMKTLVRTQVGDLDMVNSISLARLEEERDKGTLSEFIIPVENLFYDLPSVYIKESANKYLYNGNQLKENMMENKINLELSNKVKVYDCNNDFIGVYICKEIEDIRYLVPEKIFSTHII